MVTTMMNKTKIQSAVVVCDGRLVTEKMHISKTQDSNPQSSSHCTKNGSITKAKPKHSEIRKGIYRHTANTGWDFCMWQKYLQVVSCQ